MDRLSVQDITYLFIALGALLAAARISGEIAQRLGQPAVLGELLAGVVLGPTVLGTLFPELNDFFFPRQGGRAFAMDGFLVVAVTLFLLVAGLEVDFSTIWRQGKAALTVSLAGILFPFALGLVSAWSFPSLLGMEEGKDPFRFALYIGLVLSITAMPVIARTMMDLNLYRTDLGMLVMTAAMFDDLAGWTTFSVIIGYISGDPARSSGTGLRVLLLVGFIAGMLTVGRWAIGRALLWVKANTAWPQGTLAFAFFLAFAGAAITESLGVHALFGAFLVGVALGDSPHMSEHTRRTIEHFVSSIFAPIFFATVGLRANFIASFDPALCAAVFVIACAGKVIGCGLGALWSGIPRREAWSVGFCMNARGVMDIIFGLIGLQMGLISEELFVAIAVMSVTTSMMVGPIVQRILRRKKALTLLDFIRPKAFLAPVRATDRYGAIGELCDAVSAALNLDRNRIFDAVRAREETMPTGLQFGLAVPHGRIEGLSAPVIGVGLSPEGIDFDAPDGEPAKLVFLILTPDPDQGAQVAILRDIATRFKKEQLREKAFDAQSYTEFVALLKSEQAPA